MHTLADFRADKARAFGRLRGAKGGDCQGPKPDPTDHAFGFQTCDRYIYRASLPLNRSGRFRGDVIGHAVDALDLVDDAGGGFAQEIMAKGVIIRCHPIN